MGLEVKYLAWSGRRSEALAEVEKCAGLNRSRKLLLSDGAKYEFLASHEHLFLGQSSNESRKA